MEQGVGEGAGGDMNKQPHQESRGDHAQVQAPQQPQKCPRCDSLNTKFCYYNNYSLSQPRYFCKTCRRYWTQGGTLRNVPVGGGCRKGKRARTSNPSSSENISSSRSLPQQQPPPPPLTSVVNAKDSSSSVVGSPFYRSVGYLSSLAAMHSLNPSISSPPFDVAGSDALRSSNLSLLSGFNVQRPIRPPHLYQMGSGEREVVSLYGQGFVNPSSSMPNTNTNTNTNTITSGSGSGFSQHDWPHSFINNNNNNATNRASEASLWSTISTTTTTIGGNSERTSTNGLGVGSSSSLVANQWPNLPGYGPPP